MSKRMTINPNLTGEDGHKVYHAYILDRYHVNMIPIVQRPSGRLTYRWKTSGGITSPPGVVFDTRFEARDDAIEVLTLP